MDLQDAKVGNTSVRVDEVQYALLDTGTTEVKLPLGDLQQLAIVLKSHYPD